MDLASPTHVFRAGALDEVAAELGDCHLAIGNFDGMHRGHQAVVARAIERAEASGRPAVLLTFEPHPRDYFQASSPVFRLTPPSAKIHLAKAVGLDGVAILPFDASLAGLDAEAFVERFVTGALRARSVAVGWDFHFGRGRSGSPAVLERIGAAAGFAVDITPAFAAEDGETVSSSRIRQLIAAGDMPAAAGLLGYRWFFDAEVVHGDKRGRTIGYPTANMRLGPATTLAHGIYAVEVILDGERLGGVASFGRRPTFDNGAPVFETFLFDYAGDLYGRRMRITPIAFLRPEARFDSVEALVAQMDRDSAESRALISALGPGSPLDIALRAA